MIQELKKNLKPAFTGFILSGLIFIGTGCGNKPAKTQAEAAEDGPVSIYTFKALSGDVPQTQTYASTILANAINNIAPVSVSRIQKMNVEVGDFVYKGQILAEMDKVQLNQARLKLANDSTEFGRLRGLYEKGGLAKSDFEAKELALRVSQSSYANLYENTILRSPISGVITSRNYDRGDLFSMSKPIYVVQQISPVKLLVGVSESDYTKVKKGDKVVITADAIPEKEFYGTVNRIHPTIDAASRTFITEIVVNNKDRLLRPGMYAKVKITFGINHSVIVPDEAIVKMQGSGQRAVYIVQPDSTVKFSPVTLGKHFDTYYEILSGVSEGDEVATKGGFSLKNGSKVKVLNK